MDSRLILILSLVVACSSGSPGDDVGATSLPGIGTGGGTTEDEDEGEVEGEDGSGKLDVGAGKDVPDSTEECAAEVLEADLQHGWGHRGRREQH
jgi:hypothetical protein